MSMEIFFEEKGPGYFFRVKTPEFQMSSSAALGVLEDLLELKIEGGTFTCEIKDFLVRVTKKTYEIHYNYYCTANPDHVFTLRYLTRLSMLTAEALSKGATHVLGA
jgi:hypothetical protein